MRVPKENILGTLGSGFLTAMKTLDVGRLGLAAGCVGAAKEATAASASGGRVWAAVGKVAYGPRTPEDAFLKSLSDLGRPAATIRFGQEVVLFRFDPNPNLPPGPTCGGPLS